MRADRFRWVAVVALFALVVTGACSGGPAPSSTTNAAPLGEGSGLAETGSGSVSSGSLKGGGGGNYDTGGASSGGGALPSTATTGQTVSATGQTTSVKEQVKRSEKLEKGLPEVNLWPKETNRMGIFDDKIVLCGHAALVFAEVFDIRPEDLNVYWEWVNDNGGIYGRKVELTFEDDAYRPDNAVQAAERCKTRNPFMLLGGIGFDQIPAVRAWNEQEQNRFLYLHHIARADLSKRYSFSYLPTVEQMGVLGARWILGKHANKNVGAVWRQSEAWEPGHKTFVGTLDKAGKELVADLPVQQNQAVYSQQIAELQARDAETVFVWENALAATELIAQAKKQDYHPTWLIFPFQLTTDTIRQDALNPPLEGISAWPAYVPGESGGPFSPYGAEIRRFEAAQRQYGRAQNGNDILWMVWIAWKQLHQLLLDCGPDCGRNEAVAHLISGQHKAVAPNCPFDFTRNQHVGGIAGNIFKAFPVPSYGPGVGWKNTTTCARI